MGYGTRDSFAENVGDYLLDDGESYSGLDMAEAPRRRRKAKKNRSMGRKSHKKRVKRSRSHRSPRGRVKSKRKGMSKEFLRNLRKKHHLGEFKKR